MSITGLDILDFFRGVQPWTRLFRLLRQLPHTSRFQVAIQQDEERADERLREGENPRARSARPPLETWTQEAELLALIADLLACQRADYAAVHSKSHRWRKPDLVPRPATALDRARQRTDMARHHDIVKSVLGTERNGGGHGSDV